jgi:uncharacterized protein (TIGR00661 family)
MARILYGVQGDSNGHLSRALTVAELLKGHEILFAGGGSVAQVRRQGRAHEPLPLLATPLKDDRVDLLATARAGAGALCGRSKWIRRLAEIIRAFDPALILTDYEYFTPLAARRAGRTCISLDHQHVLTRTRYEPPPGQRLSRCMTAAAIRGLMSRASRYFMSSFYHPPVRDPRCDELFGTLVRADALGLAPSSGDHAVVYVRGADFGRLCRLLSGRRREYRIYGFGRHRESGNLKFRDLSRGGFLADLASSAYVVSNAGHGLLSEALQLGKPILCFPTRLAYEQCWNAIHVERGGYGACAMRLDVSAALVDAFESRLATFRRNIAGRSFCGREALRRRLTKLLGDPGGGDGVIDRRRVAH